MAKDLRLFSAPVLRGGRFADHAIPVDVLNEFVAYRDLVMELAKQMFRERRKRQRVSAGFEQAFQLKLSGVEKDCAIPVLTTAVPESELASAGEEDLSDFEAARDLVEVALKAIAEGKDLPQQFPEELVPLLEDFGASLQPDESIELRRPGSTTGVVYDLEVRNRLQRRKAKKSYVKDDHFEGAVIAFDWDGPSCRVRTSAGWTLTVKLPYGAAGDFLRALKERKFLRVWVSGDTRFAPGDIPTKIEALHAFEVWSGTDEANVSLLEQHIEELQALQPGWLDGQGAGVAPKTLDLAKRLLINLMAERWVPRPRLYATPEGGIEAEWTFGAWEVSATIDAEGKEAWLHAANVETLKDDDATVQLDATTTEEEFETFLRKFGAFGEGMSDE